MKPFQYPWERMDAVPTRRIQIHPEDPHILLPVRRSRRRLEDVDYSHPECICLVTISVADRKPIFSDPDMARAAQEILLNRRDTLGIRLDAYVIMPDHAHIVLSPGGSGLPIGQIIGGWKSLVARRLWTLGISGSPWHRNFDDRILRASECRSEGHAAMIRYVLDNPVRKGLAKTWRDYPFCGCFVPIDV